MIKTSTFFTITGCRLNHLPMILIYNEELDEIKEKRSLLKRRILELILIGCINFEHLLALVCLLLLLNRFHYALRLSKKFKIFLWFQGVLEKKTLERNGLMLSWGVFHEVCTKPNAGFWTIVSPCTHICGLGLPSPPTCDAYVMFFAKQSLHHLPNHNACNTFL